jgi:hypothetical protein
MRPARHRHSDPRESTEGLCEHSFSCRQPSASTGWHGETPLWYYVLREADACAGGHRFGPVGGRIVTEVLVGHIDADATSYRQRDQEWRPQKTLDELLASYQTTPVKGA